MYWTEAGTKLAGTEVDQGSSNAFIVPLYKTDLTETELRILN